MTRSNGTISHLKTPWTKTPLIYSRKLSLENGCQVYLKLDNLQPSGSFKSRGIGNYLLAHLKDAQAAGNDITSTHFYSSSGGNAGLACVHAAVTLGTMATVVVPLNTSEYMMNKIREAGAADLIQVGASWKEADAHLREVVLPEARARGEIAVYVPPFDDPLIWEGHATIVREVVEQLQEQGHSGGFDAFICSVGGGGLFCGVTQGLEELGLENTAIIAVETLGADSLAQSLQQGELITLPKISSIATTLGARTVARKAFENGLKPNVKSIVLEDKEAVLGCTRFADDERFLVEASCGVSIAMCYDGRLKEALPQLSENSKVIVEVCGGSNVSLGILDKYVKTICQ